MHRSPARPYTSSPRDRGVKDEPKKPEEKRDDALTELCQRMLSDVQDVHSVRKVLSSFHRPLTASGILFSFIFSERYYVIQYISYGHCLFN